VTPQFRARASKDLPPKKTSYTFGILTTPAKDIFHSNYHRGLLSGIVPRVKAVGGRLKILMMPSLPYRSLDQILSENSLDALLILTWRWIHPSLSCLIEKKRHSRVLVVNDPMPGLGVNLVYTDTDAGMKQAVAHLVREGRSGIGMVHGPVSVTFGSGEKKRRVPFIDTRLKRSGFLKALREKRVSGKSKWMRAGAANTEAEGFRVMKLWLREKNLPAAIVCGNDDLAFGVLRAIKEAGRRVPRDMAVTGFDDNERAKNSRPPLTTVRQPLARMGRDAVDILVRKIRNPSGKVVSRKYLPKLIVRKTA